MPKDTWAHTKEEIREYILAAGLDPESETTLALYESICAAIDQKVARIARNRSFVAKALGSITSKKKAVASRENGKKGGRPKKAQ